MTQTLLREAFGSVANKEINAHNTGAEPHERHAQTVCGCVTYLLSTTFSLSLARQFFYAGSNYRSFGACILVGDRNVIMPGNSMGEVRGMEERMLLFYTGCEERLL